MSGFLESKPVPAEHEAAAEAMEDLFANQAIDARDKEHCLSLLESHARALLKVLRAQNLTDDERA